MSSEKTNLPSLRNIEWKTLKIETNKINHILPYIPTSNITELNELIYAGAKLVYEKFGIYWKGPKKQSKPGWKIRLGTQITKLRKQARMIKRERRWNKREQKGTSDTRKNNSTTWGNKPESAGERKKINEIWTKGKTIQTKQDFPKQWKKILSTIGREWLENIPTTRYQRNRMILDKIMATKITTKIVNWYTILQEN